MRHVMWVVQLTLEQWTNSTGARTHVGHHVDGFPKFISRRLHADLACVQRWRIGTSGISNTCITMESQALVSKRRRIDGWQTDDRIDESHAAVPY